MKNIFLAIVLATFSFSIQAATKDNSIKAVTSPWSILGGLGYTWYNFGYHGGDSADPDAQHAIDDGQTPFGRLAIARELAEVKCVQLGLELGVQSGNTMRLNIPQTTLDILGGVPIEANIKPMLDLLATAKTHSLMNIPVFAITKLGIAYRRMQIEDRVTVNDLSEVGFEVQAGLGWYISDKANLAILYQGVFDGETSFTVNELANTGHISNIPSQNGVLMTFAYAL